jgi:hypothetical protein
MANTLDIRILFIGNVVWTRYVHDLIIVDDLIIVNDLINVLIKVQR